MLFRALIIATAPDPGGHPKPLPEIKVAVRDDFYTRQWRLPRLELNRSQSEEQAAVEAAHLQLRLSPLMYLTTHTSSQEMTKTQVLLFAFLGPFPQDLNVSLPGHLRWVYIRELPHLRLEMNCAP